MRKKRYQNITWLIVLIVLIVFVNIIATFRFFRIDLTADKRYTLSEVTKNEIRSLEDVIYIQIFLDGEMPIGFQKMKKSVEELLDEFRVYNKQNIQYSFIDPAQMGENREREVVYQDLYDRGLDPTNVKEKSSDGSMTEKTLFPGAIITYRGKEMAVNFLKNNPLFSSEVNLNNSIQMLEYEFINAFKMISIEKKKRIAIIEGHGELNEYEMEDLTRELSKFYEIDRVKIFGLDSVLNPYQAVIIAQPEEHWSEQDKFVLDQYIMNGGNVLFAIDAVRVNTDSLAKGIPTFALINEVNLEDQLFRYGVRINPVLVQDMHCNVIPVNTSVVHDQPRFVPAPWMYHPLIIPPGNHSITKNLNLIEVKYASNIDTLAISGIRKSVLLASSQYSRVLNAPMVIQLAQVKERVDPNQLRNPFQTIGVLLEGRFQSVFQNRMISEFKDNPETQYLENGKKARLIIISDGDIAKNDVQFRSGRVMISELGYDRYTKQTFGNKEFLMNAIHYLTGESALLSLRSQEFKLRLLDKERINQEKVKWKLINAVLPVFVIIFFGYILYLVRKYKYTR